MGEYQELGFDVTYTPATAVSFTDRNKLLDAFIEQAIEANGLACGGGGLETMELFVTRLKRRGSATDADRHVLQQWLQSHVDVVAFHIGELRDAWYGQA